MKIVFFGDSLTQGTFGVSYVDKVAAALRGHHFINQGVNGDTSLNLYRRVDTDVIAERPDGVFLMIGVNDAVSSAEPASRSFYRFVKRVPGGQVSPVSFRENIRAILGKLEAAHIKIWVALPPIEYNPALVKTLRQMNDYAAEVCTEMHIPTLNLMAALVPSSVPERPPIGGLSTYAKNFRVLLAHGPYNRLQKAGGYSYSFDGIHLTDEGAQRMADLIVPFLRVNGAS